MTKCLIVDDEEQNRYFLDVLLRGHGYETMTAVNGEDALNKLRLNPPDLIISDIMMPVMDGFQFCRECKNDQKLKEIPFVFYTAQYTEKQDEKFALALGADQFIIKPQEPEILLEIINEVLHLNKFREGAGKPSLDREAYLSAHDERIVKKLEEKMADMAKMNLALRESEEKYRLLAENVHDVIFILDMNLNYNYVSPSVKFLRGYEPAEMVGRRVSETLTPASWDMATRLFSEEVERKKIRRGDFRESRTIELEMMKKDGTTIWTEVNVSLLRDDKNHPTGILGVTRDITERKKAAEALGKSLAQLRDALAGTVQAMAALVETRDPYTAGHQRRVTGLAVALAGEIGLSHDQIDGLRMACTIHDVGKISIPTEILAMTRKLTDIEFSLIKTHAQAGHDIMKDIRLPWSIARIILEHHERMDGSGYPNGLTGDHLLIESRILSVADVVEAMVSHRPYRPALGIDAALQEITGSSGVRYDPVVVNACVRLFKETGYRIGLQVSA